MTEFIQAHFLEFKAFHVVCIISWMAGIFYLPRLFVYHATPKHQYAHDVYVIMERKLYKMIMIPALIGSWISGILIAWHHYFIFYYNIQLAHTHHVFIFSNITEWWLVIKLCGVVLLTFYHMYLNSLRIKFMDHENTHSHVYYRYLNEVPTILMIIIVFMAILKPF